jgi:hypothetical protein
MSLLPLASLLEVVVIDEQVKWSKVEEEADIKQSKDLGNCFQEDEEAMVVRALSLQVFQDSFIQLKAFLFFFLLLFLSHLIWLAFHFLVGDNSIFALHLLLLNGFNHFLLMLMHRSTPNSANLLSNNLAAWMLFEGLRVKTVKVTKTSHGGVTDKNQLESIL